MCGIVGIISKHKTNQIEQANRLIQHRGPDDDGVYVGDDIALGHQRLAILDLSEKGHQPMWSADRRYVIVFNGEIYNHLVIRQELEDKYEFISTTDTETILYAYIEYGEALFERLNGIFAFSVFDTKDRTLTVVRDHFGIKPLYYYVDEEQLLFSSELKAISSLPGLDRTVDPRTLVTYLNFLWSPGEATPFQAFKKLLPGHYLKTRIDNISSTEMHRYYDIPFNGKRKELSEEEWIDKLDVALQRAVERQLLSDVPVGFFLSGGLDSSLIVALAAKIKGNSNFNCYTIKTSEADDFEGFTNDLHYARRVAEHVGVHLIEVEAKADIIRDFDKMIWHLDEPQADAAPLNVLNICAAARRNGDIVLLGGTAGDDLFSGYRRHQALQFEKYLSRIPRPIMRVAKRVASQLNPKNATNRRIRKLLANADLKQTERLAAYYQWIALDVNKSLFHPRFQTQIESFNPQDHLLTALQNIPKEQDRLNQLLYWDMKFFLTDHNLNYTDKLSMAEGIEVRVPFLDKELVELSTQIPTELKLKGNTTKYILKKVAERYLPNEVIYRPKSGFGAPVRDWVVGELKDLVAQRLSVDRLNDYNIFDAQNVQQLIFDNQEGKIDASYTIWGLLAIDSWLRQFMPLD
jgi:asparagine synthase (glutamine-hydrolysing)